MYHVYGIIMKFINMHISYSSFSCYLYILDLHHFYYFINFLQHKIVTFYN